MLEACNDATVTIGIGAPRAILGEIIKRASHAVADNASGRMSQYATTNVWVFVWPPCPAVGDHPRRWSVSTVLLSALCVTLLVGCDAPAPDGEPASTNLAQQPLQETDPTAETWDAVFAGDSKIGYVHTKTHTVGADNSKRIKIQGTTELKISRDGQTAEMRIDIESLEKTSGTLQSFSCETAAGGTPIRVTGRFDNGRLHVETKSLGAISEDSIAWDESYGGFFAVEQSLRRDPMQPGETRQLTALVPEFSSVFAAKVRLQALERESTQLLEGSQTLLKIQSTLEYGMQPITITYWTDARGEALKSHVELLDQTTYRTTKQRALAAADVGGFDLMKDLLVPVEMPVDRPHDTKEIVYRVQMKTGNPAKVFPSGPSQLVRQLDEHTAEITVRAILPNDPETVPEQTPPGPAELASNNLIQADDPQIAELAESVATDEKDRWQVCLALESWVHEGIVVKSFSQGFATAADVVRSREGDCTEHAVLLAALCRARDIPARVVVGLVYSPRDHGFAFHMWDEVWVHDRWVPLDATWGVGGIGAAHLKLKHAALSQQDAGEAVRGVLTVLQQLTIEAVEAGKK
jgi:hypothetical protein